MTPLLWAAMSLYTKPQARRSYAENVLLDDIIGPHRADIHSFDCSALLPFLTDSSKDGTRPEDGARRFLPAPATWIEMFDKGTGFRTATLLTGEDDEGFGDCFKLSLSPQRAIYALKLGRLGKHIGPPDDSCSHWAEAMAGALNRKRINSQHTGPLSDEDCREGAKTAVSMQIHAMWCLEFINTPGIIGIKVHDAHKGRMRKLKALGVGSFPLGAWTELTIGKPTVDRGGIAVDSHHSDRKPLHFVRAHRKPSLDNRLIPAHWRGNAAYGIRRSRYKVQP